MEKKEIGKAIVGTIVYVGPALVTSALLAVGVAEGIISTGRSRQCHRIMASSAYRQGISSSRNRALDKYDETGNIIEAISAFFG